MEKIIIIQSVIIILLIGIIIYNSANKTKTNVNVKPASIPLTTEKIFNNKPQTKNILIIGNSISIHGICEYWWGNWGMAASSKEKDYAHILANKISKDNNVNLAITNYALWEVNSHDRSEFLDLLKPILEYKYDYIIIQLGENITKDTKTLVSDFSSLVNYISNNNKKSKIVVIGNFWKNKKIDKIKIDISNRYKLSYVDLKEIQNKKYQAGIGYKVCDNNSEHFVEHDGVAKHPNDLAMQYIADKIYEKIN